MVVLLLLLLFFPARFRQIGGLLLTLAVRALFDDGRWDVLGHSAVRCTPLWPASWLPVVDKTQGSKSAEVQRVWEVYDERLQFVSRQKSSLCLMSSLDQDDVSLFWSVWSRGLLSLHFLIRYQYSGGSFPSRSLVLG